MHRTTSGAGKAAKAGGSVPGTVSGGPITVPAETVETNAAKVVVSTVGHAAGEANKQCEAGSQAGKEGTMEMKETGMIGPAQCGRLFGLPSLSGRIGLIASMIVIYAAQGVAMLLSNWVPDIEFVLAPVFAYLLGDWLVGLNRRFGKGGPSPRAHRLIKLFVWIILALWVAGLVAAALFIATGKWPVAGR